MRLIFLEDALCIIPVRVTGSNAQISSLRLVHRAIGKNACDYALLFRNGLIILLRAHDGFWQGHEYSHFYN